jgi:hypothetical protein
MKSWFRLRFISEHASIMQVILVLRFLQLEFSVQLQLLVMSCFEC